MYITYVLFKRKIYGMGSMWGFLNVILCHNLVIVCMNYNFDVNSACGVSIPYLYIALAFYKYIVGKKKPVIGSFFFYLWSIDLHGIYVEWLNLIWFSVLYRSRSRPNSDTVVFVLFCGIILLGCEQIKNNFNGCWICLHIVSGIHSSD